VEVYVANDTGVLTEQVQHLELRLLLSGLCDPEHLQVKFNGLRLGPPAEKDGWLIFPLTPRQPAVGHNLVTLRDARPAERMGVPALEKVEVHVRYRPEPAGVESPR
jgi:hypothetical protein